MTMNHNDRVLVTYATRYDSTAGVAEQIANALRASGHEVDVCPVREAPDLGPYGAVALGSPVFAGRCLGDAADFLQVRRNDLNRMRVAYFTVGLLLRSKPEEGLEVHRRAIEKLRRSAPEVEPVAVGNFVGALDKRKLGRPLRWLMTLMRAEEGDFRDAEAIRQWAEGLSERLRAAKGSPV
jgi:menaquinone-dependent protoporphyrinogen oxidase